MENADLSPNRRAGPAGNRPSDFPGARRSRSQRGRTQYGMQQRRDVGREALPRASQAEDSVVLQSGRAKERAGTDRGRPDRGYYLERVGARTVAYFSSRSDGLTQRLNLTAEKKL